MWEKIKQYTLKQIKDVKDSPKLIIKKWWFWLLIISIVYGIFTETINTNENTLNETNTINSTVSEEKQETEEEKKAREEKEKKEQEAKEKKEKQQNIEDTKWKRKLKIVKCQSQQKIMS